LYIGNLAIHNKDKKVAFLETFCIFGVMITKEDVIKAFDVIEQYQKQELLKIKDIDELSDNRPIHILNLPIREAGVMKAKDIHTIGQLLRLPPHGIYGFRNLGKKGVHIINTRLKSLGIEFNEFFDSADSYRRHLRQIK
jgi:DNA-directed RNA polymerase alpha subunit